MIKVRVDREDYYEVSINGEIATIAHEFLILVMLIYEGIKENSRDGTAQLFKKMVSDKIPICFMDEEEIDAMLSKEENS